AERRRSLESLLAEAAAPAVQISPARACASAEELRAEFESAFVRGNEGVMAKAPASLYTPGRRGLAWVKLKRPMATLDVVVTGVENGRGKRRGLVWGYTLSVRLGEGVGPHRMAYSGLTGPANEGATQF